jgi:hypothetical protein
VGFVLQVEAEEQPEISEAFSVSSVPYFVFLKVPSFSFNGMLFWVVIDALFSLGSIQFVFFKKKTGNLGCKGIVRKTCFGCVNLDCFAFMIPQHV